MNLVGFADQDVVWKGVWPIELMMHPQVSTDDLLQDRLNDIALRIFKSYPDDVAPLGDINHQILSNIQGRQGNVRSSSGTQNLFWSYDGGDVARQIQAGKNLDFCVDNFFPPFVSRFDSGFVTASLRY